jgi:hypothetical protein
VKKAVDESTYINFTNATISKWDINQPCLHNIDGNYKIKNYVYDGTNSKRSFLLSVENPIKIDTSSCNTETTFPIKVLSDKNAKYFAGGYSGAYSACTIQIKYDASKLTLKRIKPSSSLGVGFCDKSEVTDSSGNCYNLSTLDGNDTIASGWCTANYSISATDDINIFDEDFLYVTFTPKNGYEKSKIVTKGAITFTLVKVSNTSQTKYANTGFTSTDGSAKAQNNCEAVADLHFTYTDVMKGDVNEDSYIDLIDVTEILRFFNNKTTLTKSQQNNGDVDGNGVLKLTDAYMILQYVNSAKKVGTNTDGSYKYEYTKPAGWVDD